MRSTIHFLIQFVCIFTFHMVLQHISIKIGSKLQANHNKAKNELLHHCTAPFS